MNNREIIMAQSLELFSLKGYDSVGIQEICNNSNITKPTLYHYFGSKTGLLREIIVENSKKLLEAISQASDYKGDLPLTVNKTVRVYFNFAKNNPHFYRIKLSSFYAPVESDLFKATEDLRYEEYKLLEGVFIKASQDHGNMKNKQAALAITFLGHVSTYIGMWLNNYKHLDEELVFSASHQFMHGIYS